jgi:hypothetical protein
MVEGESAGRHDAMDMGMVLQFLIPGVEHAEETEMGP